MRYKPVAMTVSIILGWYCLTSVATAADLSLFVGGAVPGKLRLSSIVTPGQTIQELRSGPVFGVRFSSNFVPLLGMEHLLLELLQLRGEEPLAPGQGLLALVAFGDLAEL